MIGLADAFSGEDVSSARRQEVKEGGMTTPRLFRQKAASLAVLVLPSINLALFSGCGPGAIPGPVVDAIGSPDFKRTDQGQEDKAGADTPSDRPGDEAGEVRSDLDTGSETGRPDIPDVETLSALKGFLEPCEENKECESGFCVLHAGQTVCTRPCLDECPAGWACKQVAGTGGDVTFICVSDFFALCKPCQKNEDCASPFGQAEKCLVYSEAGSFCGAGCLEGSDCPEGYRCEMARSVTGEESLQCIFATLECECTSHFVKSGYPTTCWNHNGFGMCFGERVCTPAGLSPCDARVPNQEICDGQDNDCDGQVDEKDEVKDCCEPDNGICEPFCNESLETTPCDCKVCGDGECSCGEGPATCPLDCCQVDGQPGFCGDGVCLGRSCDEVGDKGDPAFCADCVVACGDGKCQGGESCLDTGEYAQCPKDCCNACGNGVCEPGESHDGNDNTVVCPQDCKGEYCGNCQCDPGESVNNCPGDCGKTCGDGVCSHCKDHGDVKFVPVLDRDGKPVLDENGDPREEEVIICEKDCCDPLLEVCGNNKDDDCDKLIDEKDASGCEDYFADGDQDAFGSGDPLCLCENHPDYPNYSTLVSGDCDDTAASIHPAATEVCNGEDDDCDGETDEEVTCDDGNPCTVGDACLGGQCIGQGKDCTTLSDPCNDGVCDQTTGECIPRPKDDNTPCEDGDKCTLEDKCVSGKCEPGPAPNCDDGNVCTDDWCEPDKGCVHANNFASCDDKNACTNLDHCQDGVCVGGGAVGCNDGNPCTDDQCDPASGCYFPPNTAKCDDTNPNTCNDQCSNGTCSGTGGQCPSGQTQTEPCGSGGCGTRTRTCTSNCTWGEWTGCALNSGAECWFGQAEERSCPYCGTDRRVCGSDCRWGPWGGCYGECKPATPCQGVPLCAKGGSCGPDCKWHCDMKTYGWKERNGHCYKFEEAGKNQSQADQFCSGYGGRLASICGVGERDFILNNVTSKQAWLGLFCDVSASQCKDKSKWRWVGTDNCGGGTPYKNWESGQPSGDGKCGHQLDGGKWNDRPCEHELGTICETIGKPKF